MTRQPIGRRSETWNNNLSLNVTKTKEMIVDYRKRKTEHAPILIDGAVVEQLVAGCSLVSTSPTNMVTKTVTTTRQAVPEHQV